MLFTNGMSKNTNLKAKEVPISQREYFNNAKQQTGLISATVKRRNQDFRHSTSRMEASTKQAYL